MTDVTIPFIERMGIYRRIPAEYQRQIYDAIYPTIVTDLQRSDIREQVSIDQALPIPPGIEAHRQQKALDELRNKQRQSNDAQTERR